MSGFEEFEYEEVSEFSATPTIETLAQAYFRLCGELKTAREWFERRRIVRQQKDLERDIFSTPATTALALQKKTRVYMHILESEDHAHRTRKELQDYGLSMAEDMLAFCGGARRGTGPYKPECIVNYYSWMVPDHLAVGRDTH